MNQKLTILVTGDRNWRDAVTIWDALDETDWFALMNPDWNGIGNSFYEPSDILVRSGDAKGADMYADACAQILGMQTERWPADWKGYGKRAGLIRNLNMLAAEPTPDYWLGFHADIENSKGTAHMIEQLQKAGIPGKLITKEQNG